MIAAPTSFRVALAVLAPLALAAAVARAGDSEEIRPEPSATERAEAEASVAPAAPRGAGPSPATSLERLPAPSALFAGVDEVLLYANDFELFPPDWSAIAPAACSGHCGGGTGTCFCDEVCVVKEDCCLDACATCGACP